MGDGGTPWRRRKVGGTNLEVLEALEKVGVMAVLGERGRLAALVGVMAALLEEGERLAALTWSWRRWRQ